MGWLDWLARLQGSRTALVLGVGAAVAAGVYVAMRAAGAADPTAEAEQGAPTPTPRTPRRLGRRTPAMRERAAESRGRGDAAQGGDGMAEAHGALEKEEEEAAEAEAVEAEAAEAEAAEAEAEQSRRGRWSWDFLNRIQRVFGAV